MEKLNKLVDLGIITKEEYDEFAKEITRLSTITRIDSSEISEAFKRMSFLCKNRFPYDIDTYYILKKLSKIGWKTYKNRDLHRSNVRRLKFKNKII